MPVIALSGKATPEIAAELLKAGADHYLSKKDLAAETLTGCVQEALVRADAWRRHAPPPPADVSAEVARLARQLLADFASGPGPELLIQLNKLEAAVRSADLPLEQFRQVLEAVCAELEQSGAAEAPPLARVLRPVLLEMVLRLWDDPPEGQG